MSLLCFLLEQMSLQAPHETAEAPHETAEAPQASHPVSRSHHTRLVADPGYSELRARVCTLLDLAQRSTRLHAHPKPRARRPAGLSMRIPPYRVTFELSSQSMHAAAPRIALQADPVQPRPWRPVPPAPQSRHQPRQRVSLEGAEPVERERHDGVSELLCQTEPQRVMTVCGPHPQAHTYIHACTSYQYTERGDREREGRGGSTRACAIYA